MAYDNVKEVDCLDVSKEGTDAWEAASKRFVNWLMWMMIESTSISKPTKFLNFYFLRILTWSV